MSGLLNPPNRQPRVGASSTRARSAELAKIQESVAKRESEIIACALKRKGKRSRKLSEEHSKDVNEKRRKANEYAYDY